MKSQTLYNLSLCAILITVFICFSSSLLNQFVPLDDPGHLLENPYVRALNWGNLTHIFRSSVNGTYIPLTILSFAIEHHLFGFNPPLYHLNNLILHLAVVGLLFYLGRKLGLSTLGAGAGALFFGIHPMHVESVAWVTERKDVLYAFFYLLALHQYWNYLTRKDKRAYGLSLLFGLLGMLAKPMTISLPLVLFILDWFYGRAFRFSLIVEKFAYSAYIIPIAWLTLKQHPYHRTENFHDTILTLIWSFMFYPQKLFYPAGLSALYELPKPIAFSNPEYLWAAALFFVYIFCLFRYRRHRWFTFANLYFINSIFFLIRPYSGRDMHFVADRFMYLPSMGFCFFIGHLIEEYVSRNRGKTFNLIRMAGLIVIFAALGIKTHAQAKIWKNDESLLNHMIQNNSYNPFPYFARGKMHQDRGEHATAISDYSKAIALGPDWSQAYNNRGIVYTLLGNDPAALKDFEMAISINPHNAQFYNNRGLVHYYTKNDRLAMADFNQSIKLNPRVASTHINRARLYHEGKQFKPAIEDLTAALRYEPSAATHETRSMLYEITVEYHRASRDAAQGP
jgi:tetratricopeptide (TPR) repeat protein